METWMKRKWSRIEWRKRIRKRRKREVVQEEKDQGEGEEEGEETDRMCMKAEEGEKDKIRPGGKQRLQCSSLPFGGAVITWLRKTAGC